YASSTHDASSHPGSSLQPSPASGASFGAWSLAHLPFRSSSSGRSNLEFARHVRFSVIDDLAHRLFGGFSVAGPDGVQYGSMKRDRVALAQGIVQRQSQGQSERRLDDDAQSTQEDRLGGGQA